MFAGFTAWLRGKPRVAIQEGANKPYSRLWISRGFPAPSVLRRMRLTLNARSMPGASPEIALTTTELYLWSGWYPIDQGRRHPTAHSPFISSGWPSSEATWLEPKILLQKAPPCGENSYASQISSSASSWALNLSVIESWRSPVLPQRYNYLSNSHEQAPRSLIQ